MKRLGILTIFSVLFIVFVIVWNYSYQEGLEEAYIPLAGEPELPIIPSERAVFERQGFALDYLDMPVDEKHQRLLKDYYTNKAYPGAPPSIPHPVKEKMGLGGKVCLQCHQNGGYVDKFQAYAPVTPHPEMINCKQCHVEQNTSSSFKGSQFYKKSAPEVGINAAFEGGPPTIPHQLQMRENCLACHGGPAAVKELRVDHPDRVNCRQCHVPQASETKQYELFARTNPFVND